MAEHGRGRAIEPQLTYCCSPEPEPERKVEMPVRSRWIPKPGQITILESIFNSGMVNPSKEATEMIRKMLEKYGHVADTSIFYWFQNRRSKSRRHQRQLQSQAQAQQGEHTTIQFADYMSVASSSSSPVHGNDSYDHSTGGFISFSDPVKEYEQNQIYFPPGMITVFINGFRTEVGRGPVDMRTMFTGSLVMYDSSGNLVEMNEYGIVVQGLQDGKSYVVVAHP